MRSVVLRHSLIFKNLANCLQQTFNIVWVCMVLGIVGHVFAVPPERKNRSLAMCPERGDQVSFILIRNRMPKDEQIEYPLLTLLHRIRESQRGNHIITFMAKKKLPRSQQWFVVRHGKYSLVHRAFGCVGPAN